MKKFLLPLVATIITAGIITFVACTKELDNDSSNWRSMPAAPKQKSIKIGLEEQVAGIPLDMKRDPKTNKCKRYKKIHICIDWPWIKTTEFGNIVNLKIPFMYPNNYNKSNNELEMTVDYSLLSDEEKSKIDSQLLTMDSLQFPEFNIKYGKMLEKVGVKNDVHIDEGMYSIKRSKDSTSRFYITLYAFPIQNE